MDAEWSQHIDEFILRLHPGWVDRTRSVAAGVVTPVGGINYQHFVEKLHKEAEQRLSSIARIIELTSRRDALRIEPDALEVEFRNRTLTVKNEVLLCLTSTFSQQHINNAGFETLLSRHIDSAIEWTAEDLVATARDLRRAADSFEAQTRSTNAQEVAAEATKESAIAASSSALSMKVSAFGTMLGALLTAFIAIATYWTNSTSHSADTRSIERDVGAKTTVCIIRTANGSATDTPWVSHESGGSALMEPYCFMSSAGADRK